MLTTTHIITLAGLGMLFSSSLWAVTEWTGRRVARHESLIRRWLPVALGVALGTVLFPLAYGQVVQPVPLTAPRWLLLGAFLGLVGAAGSRVAHDTVGPVFDRLLAKFTS